MSTQTNREIQRKADALLIEVLTETFKAYNFHLIIRPQNDQDDIGIDYEVEVKNRENGNTMMVFKLQNKGTETPQKTFKLIKSGINKDLRSWQTDVKHVKYYRQQITLPTIFFVCDLIEKKAYWHSIQLDGKVEQTIDEAINNPARKTDNIQIYIAPENELNGGSFIRLWKDISEAQEIISKRFIKFPENDALVSKSFTFKEQGLAVKESILSVVKLFTVVKTIPANTIVKLYPFSLTQRMPSTYDNFCLRTNNVDLYNFFLQLQNFNSNSIELVSEIEKEMLLQFLIDNLIFWVEYKKKLVNIVQLVDHFKYNSYKSELFKMNLNAAFVKLKDSTTENCEKILNKAYGFYLFGNFHEAILLNKSILTHKEKDSNAYIILAKYNLKQLERLGQIYFRDIDYKDSLVGLNRINLNQDIALSNKIPDYLKIVLSEIYTNVYLNVLFDRIDSHYMKIEEHRFKSQKGGFGYNYLPNELTNDLSMLINMLENNSLVFQHLRPFVNSMHKAIAGLFRLHSIRNANYSKLESLSSFHLCIFVQFGKPEFLKRLIKENKTKTIKIQKSKDLAWDFLSIIENTFMEMDLNFLDQLENKNLFIQRYKDWVNNIVLFFTQIEIEQSVFNQLFKKFADFLRYSSGLIPIQKGQLVLDFLNFKNKLLSPEQLLDLLIMPVVIEDFTDMTIIQNTSVVLHEEYPNFIYDDNIMIDKIIAKSLESRELNILPFFYLILDNENKIRIKKIVTDQLNEKFDSYLFKLCSHFDVIPFSQRHMDKLWELSYPDKSLLNTGNIFGLDSEYIHELNEFLDLAFKYNYILSPKSIKVIEDLNEYYYWLMNMESFDYSKFKIIWLTYHISRTFLLKIRDVPQVKDILVKNILSVNNETLIKIYFDYFAS